MKGVDRFCIYDIHRKYDSNKRLNLQYWLSRQIYIDPLVFIWDFSFNRKDK
jgi:hypothetical protein